MDKKDIQTIDLNKEDTEEKLTNILCRQTDLSKANALELLRKHNYSLKLALFDYNKIEVKKQPRTINQERYKLIRQSLDGTFNQYAN